MKCLTLNELETIVMFGNAFKWRAVNEFSGLEKNLNMMCFLLESLGVCNDSSL